MTGVLMRDKRRGHVETEEEVRPQAKDTCSRQQLEEVGRTLPRSPRRSMPHDTRISGLRPPGPVVVFRPLVCAALLQQLPEPRQAASLASED